MTAPVANRSVNDVLIVWLIAEIGIKECLLIGLHLFNDDTRPSGHISCPNQRVYKHNSCEDNI